jgi:hypothetical protein
LGFTAINKVLYLYSVNDPVLTGVEQVTAAHELLHIGYSRLSSSELKYVNGLVLSTYNNLAPTYPLLNSEYQSYLKGEGAGAVANEMHSVLGTEIGNLPQPLEDYYKKYFTNRQAIVNYANNYEKVFTQRQSQVAQDDKQMLLWQQQINTNQQQLQLDETQLQSQQNILNQQKNNGQAETYNNSVNSYNFAVSKYNILVAQTKSLISQYNQLVVDRNNLANSEDKLIQSISSLPNTISSQ